MSDEQPSVGRQWSAGSRPIEPDERLVKPGMKRVLPYGQPMPISGMKTEQMRQLIKNVDDLKYNVNMQITELKQRWQGPEIDTAIQDLESSAHFLEAARFEFLKIHGVINYGLGR